MARWWNPTVQAGGRRLSFWAQLGIAVGFYVIYTLVGDIAKASKSTAIANSLKEVRFERAWHFFDEHAIQHYFLRFPNLIKFANLYYVTVHFVLPVVILILLFRRDGARFRLYRNAFAVLTVIGFVIYLFFPVAPPRLLPSSFHFIDTQARYGGAGNLDATLMKESGDPYGAMPSLHFGWALWCTIAGYRVTRSVLGRVLLVIHPILTIWVVVVTANHFFVDIIAGGVVVVVSLALVGAVGPLKPTWWRETLAQSPTLRRVVFVDGLRSS